MEAFDEYSLLLLEQAKRFLEKAKIEAGAEGKSAYLNCALLLGICSLEALVNGIVEDISNSKGFEVYEQSILREKDIFVTKGEVRLGTGLKMSRLIDRIEIIYFKFTKKHIDFQKQEWGDLKFGIDLRNKLVHPKENIIITIKMTEQVLKAVVFCVDNLFKTVYRRGYPKIKKELQSELSF